MSRKSDEVARRAAQIQRPARISTPLSEATEPAPTPRTVPRAKPIRITTDLAPQSYRALGDFCADLAGTLGRARVPHSEVIRALVAELAADEALRTRVAESVNQLSK